MNVSPSQPVAALEASLWPVDPTTSPLAGFFLAYCITASGEIEIRTERLPIVYVGLFFGFWCYNIHQKRALLNRNHIRVDTVGRTGMTYVKCVLPAMNFTVSTVRPSLVVYRNIGLLSYFLILQINSPRQLLNEQIPECQHI